MRLILAIILAGIGLYAQSPAQRQVSVFGTPPAWTPAQLTATPEVWLDAADSSTITLNGAAVAAWADKTGNARNAIQESADNQPTYESTLNVNRPTLKFDGSNDFMLVASWGTIAQPFTRVFVWEPVTISSLKVVVSTETGTPLTADRYFSTNAIQQFAGNSTNSVAAVVGTPYVRVSQFSASNSAMVYTNGVATGPTNAGASGYAGVAFGRQSADTNYAGFKLSEFLVVNAVLSTADRQKLEGYLAWKWGLQNGLPSDHPYKSRRPTR